DDPRHQEVDVVDVAGVDRATEDVAEQQHEHHRLHEREDDQLRSAQRLAELADRHHATVGERLRECQAAALSRVRWCGHARAARAGWGERVLGAPPSGGGSWWARAGCRRNKVRKTSWSLGGGTPSATTNSAGASRRRTASAAAPGSATASRTSPLAPSTTGSS